MRHKTYGGLRHSARPLVATNQKEWLDEIAARSFGWPKLSALLEILFGICYSPLCVSDWSILTGVGFLVEEAIRTDTTRRDTMTKLRQRMMTDMKLHGLAPGTQKVYLNAVKRLAGHFSRSPDQLSEQQLRDYFTYFVEKKRVPSSTLRTEIFGVTFLFDKTLGRPWPTLKFLRARPSYKLPVVLDREEARRLIALIRCSAVGMCATMMYRCGLRISEALGLEVANFDSARMIVIVRACRDCDLENSVTGTPLSPHPSKTQGVPHDRRNPNRRLVVAFTFDDKSSVWVSRNDPNLIATYASRSLTTSPSGTRRCGRLRRS